MPEKGFNPCFNGSCSRITTQSIPGDTSEVSILVLMDLAREWSRDSPLLRLDSSVSILVLMDLAREFTIQREASITETRFQSLF